MDNGTESNKSICVKCCRGSLPKVTNTLPKMFNYLPFHEVVKFSFINFVFVEYCYRNELIKFITTAIYKNKINQGNKKISPIKMSVKSRNTRCPSDLVI